MKLMEETFSRHIFRHIAVCAVTFTLLALPSVTHATASVDKEYAVPIMGEVVVTATRTSEETGRVPANITVITNEDIIDSGATNMVDLLESKANIHFKVYNGNSSQAQIDLRGFGENGFGKTLVLLDGRRLNRPDMGAINWLQIPLQLVEKIEVVRGTQTALYGDAAVAGVVNIITKKGTAAPAANFSAIVGEHGAHVERAGIVGSADGFSYALNGEYQHDDGWRDRSTLDSFGGGLNLGYDVTDSFAISAGGSYNRTDFEMPGGLTKEEMAADRTGIQPARTWSPPAWFGFAASTPAHTDDEAENEYVNTNILLEKSFATAGDMEVDFVYGNKKITTDMPSWFAPGQYNFIEIDTYGITPKYTLASDLPGHGNKIIGGVDFYKEEVSIKQYLDLQRSRQAWDSEVEKESLGWYVRDEFLPVDDVILGVGYRTESADYEGRKTAVLGDPFVGAAFSTAEKKHREDAFDASITWLPAAGVKMYARYATLYRFPFIDEQVSFYGWMDGFNVNLDPETGRSYEVGGTYSPRAGLHCGLTFFRTDLRDEIVWDNTLNRNINLDETLHWGIEANFQYKYGERFSAYGSYAFHKAEFEAGQFSGKSLTLVPEHHFTAGLDLGLSSAVRLVPEVLYVGSSYLGNDYDNSAAKLDDYTVANLYLHYKTIWKKMKTTAFFGIKNIFNEEYETIGFENDPNNGAAPADTFYPSPGREVTAGLSFMF